jgi:hypothetical protein
LPPLQIRPKQIRLTLINIAPTFFVVNNNSYLVVFNATFSNISAISWRPVLVVVEAGVPSLNGHN